MCSVTPNAGADQRDERPAHYAAPAPAIREMRTLDRCLELHLLERGTAGELERVGERLHHLEMVVALGDDQLDRLARLAQRLGEVAALPLEFRRLERAVDHGDRCPEPVEVTHRA